MMEKTSARDTSAFAVKRNGSGRLSAWTRLIPSLICYTGMADSWLMMRATTSSARANMRLALSGKITVRAFFGTTTEYHRKAATSYTLAPLLPFR